MSPSAVCNGCDEGRLGPLAHLRFGFGELRHIAGKPVRGVGAAAGAVAGEPVEHIDGGVDDGDVVGVGRRLGDGARVERRIERLRRVLDQRQLVRPDGPE